MEEEEFYENLSDEEKKQLRKDFKKSHKKSFRHIGNYIRHQRKARNISCRTIAKKLNVSWWTVRKLEKPFYRLLDVPPSMLLQVFSAIGVFYEVMRKKENNQKYLDHENSCKDS